MRLRLERRRTSRRLGATLEWGQGRSCVADTTGVPTSSRLGMTQRPCVDQASRLRSTGAFDPKRKSNAPISGPLTIYVELRSWSAYRVELTRMASEENASHDAQGKRHKVLLATSPRNAAADLGSFKTLQKLASRCRTATGCGYFWPNVGAGSERVYARSYLAWSIAGVNPPRACLPEPRWAWVPRASADSRGTQKQRRKPQNPAPDFLHDHVVTNRRVSNSDINGVLLRSRSFDSSVGAGNVVEVG